MDTLKITSILFEIIASFYLISYARKVLINGEPILDPSMKLGLLLIRLISGKDKEEKKKKELLTKINKINGIEALLLGIMFIVLLIVTISSV